MCVMRVKTYVQIIMEEKEVAPLSKVLGSISDTKYSDIGLSSEEIKFMHDLYDKLPFGNLDD